MSGPVFGRLSWLGQELPIAAPDLRWFDQVELFTGLTVERRPTRATPTILSVLNDQQVLVDDAALREFPSPDALKAWLFLTVSDVMIMRSGFVAFHAAGIAVPGGCVLVTGPPWSGKSSWAFEAHRRGIEVLGDDQVRIDAAARVVQPLPRPLKHRLVGEGLERPLSPEAIRVQLEGEPIALEPRRTGGFAPVDRDYRVRRVVHLARHAGDGVAVRPLTKSEAFRAVLDQIRGYPPGFFLADAAAIARMLGHLPNIHMDVGDGEVGRALEIALALM